MFMPLKCFPGLKSTSFVNSLKAIGEEIKLAAQKTPQVSPWRGTEGRCKG
jgi:hypothetical protein